MRRQRDGQEILSQAMNLTLRQLVMLHTAACVLQPEGFLNRGYPSSMLRKSGVRWGTMSLAATC